MNVRSGVMVVGLGFAALSIGCSGATAGSPFHMYSSPLLEGEMRAQQPASRAFDPLRTGDHVPAQTVYAYEGRRAPASAAGSTRTARSVSAKEEERPALSSTRAVGAPETGAPSAQPPSSVADAVAEAVQAEPARPVSHEDSALAAQFVHAVYTLNGVTLSDDTRESIPALYRECRRAGKIYHASRPTVGDVVFFHNTFDANGDGRNNDWYTFVGLVEAVHPAGTADVLGYRDGKVERVHLNLEHVDQPQLATGEAANSTLRTPGAGDAPFTQYLAGQLFAGFCGLLGDRADFMVVDNWQPGMSLELTP